LKSRYQARGADVVRAPLLNFAMMSRYRRAVAKFLASHPTVGFFCRPQIRRSKDDFFRWPVLPSGKFENIQMSDFERRVQKGPAKWPQNVERSCFWHNNARAMDRRRTCVAACGCSISGMRLCGSTLRSMMRGCATAMSRTEQRRYRSSREKCAEIDRLGDSAARALIPARVSLDRPISAAGRGRNMRYFCKVRTTLPPARERRVFAEMPAISEVKLTAPRCLLIATPTPGRREVGLRQVIG
jgi:hypothetical protein